MKNLRLSLVAAMVAPLFLTGCDLALFNAAGDVAAQSGHLIIITTLIMLIIVLPVLFLTLFYAWKYREGTQAATQDYDPEWHHSTKLELVIWSVPLMIIIVLGAITWIYTHKLDPYRPLDRIDAQTPVAEGVRPLVVEVVALDWKWLFLYPEQGIATVNELAAPVNRPILFKLTATTTMNSFYVPDLAGMIYAMPSMETQLNAVINAPGLYEGRATHYSGSGFSGMHFKFHGLTDSDFDGWVAQVRSQGQALDRATYFGLAQPSERDPVQHFAQVDDRLYHNILNRCVEEGTVCMDEQMARDEVRHALNSRARDARTVLAAASLESLFALDACTTENVDDVLVLANTGAVQTVAN